MITEPTAKAQEEALIVDLDRCIDAGDLKGYEGICASLFRASEVATARVSAAERELQPVESIHLSPNVVVAEPE